LHGIQPVNSPTDGDLALLADIKGQGRQSPLVTEAKL